MESDHEGGLRADGELETVPPGSVVDLDRVLVAGEPLEGNEVRFSVARAEGGFAWYRRQDGKERTWTTDARQWRRWARGARVRRVEARA